MSVRKNVDMANISRYIGGGCGIEACLSAKVKFGKLFYSVDS